jgi:hypothetical protein
MQPLLSGHQEYVEESPDFGRLQSENHSLRMEVARLRVELESAKNDSAFRLAGIRKALRPQYDGLRQLFEELDALSPERANGSDSGRWDAIKQRLAPRLKEAVDVLILHGSLRRTQLASALKMDYSNCTKNVVGVLKGQGLLEESGGLLSLKKL